MHICIFANTQSQTKNAKESPSQLTTTDQMNGITIFRQKGRTAYKVLPKGVVNPDIRDKLSSIEHFLLDIWSSLRLKFSGKMCRHCQARQTLPASYVNPIHCNIDNSNLELL